MPKVKSIMKVHLKTTAKALKASQKLTERDKAFNKNEK